MGIYRGAGGTGDAVNDASSEATLVQELVNSATTQAANAATSATAAQAASTQAAISQGLAADSATAAASSATNASNSASAADTSATNAAASYDEFDDRYLGSKSSNPTVDNDGNALLTGALYFNTTVPEIRVWTGSIWNPVSASGSVVSSFNTRNGDVTLTSSDVTTALTYTPLAPAAIGTTVQAWDADLDTWATKTAPSGTVVGTSDTQTLTNKTLTSPVISGGTVNNAVIGGSTPAEGTFTSLSDSGNLAFTGTGNRITGDFSNATAANRIAFQTSTANSQTLIPIIANGTIADNTGSGVVVYSNSDTTSSQTISLISFKNLEGRLSVGSNTGTFAPLTMHTGGSERLRIDTSGNVGIGTSSPTQKLDVQGGRSYFASNSDAFATYLRYNNSTAGVFLGSPSANTFQISSSGGGALLNIDSSGNVGIGTSSPTVNLNVYNATSAILSVDGDSTTNIRAARYSSDTTPPTIALRKTRGTFAAQTAVATGDVVGNVNYQAYDGTIVRTIAQLQSIVETYTAADNLSSALVFTTRPTGAGNIVTERMRINGAGTMLVGLTSATSGGGVLEVSNGITFPATQVPSSNANTLDDYEEGTWTPADASGAGLTFTSVTARYTKIGNVVYINARLTYPTTADVSQAKISGLPFAPAVGANILFGGNAASINTGNAGQGMVDSASTTMTLVSQANASKTNSTLSTLTLNFSGFYLV